MGSLKNKVAIVTGSGTGIGQACALMFADEGATLVLVGRRREPLEKTASNCESRGSSVRSTRHPSTRHSTAAGIGGRNRL